MQIKQENGELKVLLSFWEKVLGLHGNFVIPKDHIVSIKEKKTESSWWDFKMPGTFLPGVIKAGTFITKRGTEYWYWTRSRPYTYVIELNNMSYKRLVLALNERAF